MDSEHILSHYYKNKYYDRVLTLFVQHRYVHVKQS